MDLSTLPTPCLVLDLDKVEANARRMRERMRNLSVRLRPHVKTHKCVEVARVQAGAASGPITVSTLAEARCFAVRGFVDQVLAVPIDPTKFDAAIELSTQLERFALLIDDAGLVDPLNDAARRRGLVIDLLVKVDSGYHRCGVDPQGPELVSVAAHIRRAANLRCAGIMTHAGHAYGASTPEERLAIAREERDTMVDAATRLRLAAFDVPTVSVGSTPTMTIIDHLEGIDEARPGNYIFFDAFQMALGSCSIEDCALTVLTCVISYNSTRKRSIVDAGAIAMSKDPGDGTLQPKFGYGRVLDLAASDTGMRLHALSQEHGWLDVSDEWSDRVRVGSRFRIVPNHSCLTAAQFGHYEVVRGMRCIDRWPIINGWH